MSRRAATVVAMGLVLVVGGATQAAPAERLTTGETPWWTAAVTPEPLPVTASVVLPGDVLFDSGRHELTSSARALLTQVAARLKLAPRQRWAVVGHTDAAGDEGVNLALSLRRAQTVADYLVSAGVDRARLSIQGRGELEPVAPNATAGGRQSNRRVELVRH